MTRPAFLTSPGSWVRTARIDQTRADYASAVTRYKHERSHRVADWVIVALLVAVIAAFAMGWL